MFLSCVCVLQLLSTLASVDANIPAIVSRGGVSFIIGAIGEFAESRELVMEAITALDNIATVNQENASIVAAEGGKDVLDAVISAYEADVDVSELAKEASATLSALAGVLDASRDAEATSATAKVKDIHKEDPLGRYRNMLAAGEAVHHDTV